MQTELAAFLDYLQQEEAYSDNTAAAYRNDLSQFLNYLQQGDHCLIAWSDVSPSLLRKYVQTLKARPYAPATIARKVAAIKAFFDYLQARGAIDEDPTDEVAAPRIKKRRPQTLSLEEVDRLLAAATGRTIKKLRDVALLALLYATGMRVTEIVYLRLGDVDLEAGSLTCNQGNGKLRHLTFDGTTRAALNAYLTESRPRLVHDDSGDAFFLNHRGRQLTRQGLWLIIKAYARKANLSVPVTPHTLRHSFATHRLVNGAALVEIQQLLGHANIATTQVYSQLLPENNTKS